MDKKFSGIAIGSIARRISQVSVGKPVIFTITALAVIGWALASLPRYWAVGELILLAACILLIREGSTVYAQDPPVRDRDDSFATSRAWCAGSAAWFEGSAAHRQNARHRPFSFWDFASPARGSGSGNINRHALVSRPSACPTMSVEQIGHEMLTHAFRQASLKHHPDHGGDPENMRRVYVVRDIFVRAIQKT